MDCISLCLGSAALLELSMSFSTLCIFKAPNILVSKYSSALTQETGSWHTKGDVAPGLSNSLGGQRLRSTVIKRGTILLS